MKDEKNTKNKIESALDKIRPMLERDGGNVKFVNFTEKTGVAEVRLQGHCAGCPMAQMTLKQVVEEQIKKEAPEVKEVVSE